MTKKSLILSAVLSFGVAQLGAPSAHASASIFGSGLGKECYDETVLGASSRRTVDLCTKAIESGTLVASDLPATYVNRGIILMRMKDFNAAIADYKRALSYIPNLAEAQVNMGAALIGLGQYGAAIEQIELSLKNELMTPHIAYYNLGLAHEIMAGRAAGQPYFLKAIELAPEWAPALRKLSAAP